MMTNSFPVMLILLDLNIGTHLTGIDFALHPGGTIRVAVLDQSGLPVHDPSYETLPHNNVWDFAEDTDSNLWIATDLGLMGIIDGVTVGVNIYNSDLPSNFVRGIADDGAGNLYFATSDGIAKYSSSSMTIYNTTNSDLPSNDCTAIAVSSGGDIFIGTEDSYFSKWDGASTFTNYTYSNRGEASSSPIHCLCTDTGDLVYIGSDEGMTEYIISTAGFTNYSGSLLSDQVYAIAAASDGTLWIGTSAGINRQNPSSPDETYTTPSLPGDIIQDFYLIGADDVWISTSSGISHFTGSFTNYTTSNSGLDNNYTTSIYKWNNKIYIGQTSGLDVLNGSDFHHISRQYFYVSFSLYDATQDLSYSDSGYDTEVNISGLPTGNYELRASASYYSDIYYDNVFFPSQATLISVTEGEMTPERYFIEMKVGGTISGTAEDHESSPLTSGTVYAYAVDDINTSYNTSVSSGAYQFNRIPPIQYYVSLYNSSYPSLFYDNVFKFSDATPVQVNSEVDTPNINFAMMYGDEGSISGHVEDELGNPYQNTTVSIQGTLGTNGSKNTTTDINGNYTLTSVNPGNYRVYASLNYLPNFYYPSTFNYEEATPVGVGSSEAVTGIDIVKPVYNPGGIVGTVVDQYDNPVGGARVTCSGEVYYPDTTSDSSGNFEFPEVAPYESYYLSAYKDGYYSNTIYSIEVLAGMVTPVTITVEKYEVATVEGVVEDASGNLLWGASVNFRDVATSTNFSTYADWEGKYLVKCPVGNTGITISKNGYIDSTTSGVSIPSGSSVMDFELDFDLSSYGVIWGQVVDSNSIPQPGIQIRAYDSSYYYATTNKDGYYVLTRITPGTYTVEVSSFQSYSTPVTGMSVGAGDVFGNVDFVVNLELGTISGKITNSDLKPITDPNVDISPVGHSNYSTHDYSDDFGNYTICGLRSGDYKIYASEDGYVRTYYNGTINPDNGAIVTVPPSSKVSGIDISLVTGEVISGIVTDNYGRPISSQQLYADNLDFDINTSSYTDNFGTYRFDTLAPGSYILHTVRNNYFQEYYSNKYTAQDADLIDLVTGTPLLNMDFSIRLGGGIAGVVTNETGTPYTSGTVYTYHTSDTDNYIASVNINVTGEYLIEHLRPGDYYLRAYVYGKPNIYYDNAYSLGTATTVHVNHDVNTNDIDFIIPETIINGTISGTITNPEGHPIASVSVRSVGVDGSSGTSYASTDSSGDYTINNIQPGSYAVYVLENNIPPYYYGGTYDQAAATRIEVIPDADNYGHRYTDCR